MGAKKIPVMFFQRQGCFKKNTLKNLSKCYNAIPQKKGCKDVHTLPSYLGSWWFDLMLKVEEALLENLGQGNML